jgi:hypothetical protein
MNLEFDVDAAYSALLKIIESTAGIDLSKETEADARFKLIDPILKDVLGWLPNQIRCEKSLDGSRLDYVLTATTGSVVVEAKRASVVFSLDEGLRSKKTYPLDGVVMKSAPTGETILQVKQYCQQAGISLAVATNGLQWIIFLASREDSVPPDRGFAFVFRSLEHLKEIDTFKQFYELLSKRAVSGQSYKVAFYKVEGRLKSSVQLKTSRLVNLEKGADLRCKISDLGKALDPVIQQLFITMSPEREREIIRECFVITRDSQNNDTRLERLLDEVAENIEPIDSRDGQGQRLHREIEQGVEIPDSRTVVLIGQIGSGKSTYLDRFFAEIVADSLKKKIMVVKLNLERSRPDQETFISFLRRETIRQLEVAIFGTEHPTFEQLKGAFNSLYHQLSRGTGKPTMQSSSIQFDVLFTHHLEELKLNHEEDYVRQLLSHCNNSVKKLPVIIYDNIDHHSNEIQTLSFQQAQWLSGLGRVFSILPVRDSTYWQASIEGPFHTHTHVTLYLPRPPIDQVLSRRFKYAELQLDELLEGKEVSITTLNGMRMIVERPKELFQVLYKLFSREKYPNHILRSLSGGNVRESLTIFHQTITSPHMPIEKLIAAYAAHNEYRLTSIDRGSFDKAVLLGQWAHFKHERSRQILNLLCEPSDADVSPLLAARILERLYDLRTDLHPRAGRGYEPVSSLLDYFSIMGVPRISVERCMVHLVKHKLLEPYDIRIFADPSLEISAENIEFVSLSSSGRLHRSWLKSSRSYGVEMIHDMTIYGDDCVEQLRALLSSLAEVQNNKDLIGTHRCLIQIGKVAKTYTLSRDADNIVLPADPLYASQRSLPERIFAWTNEENSEDWSDDDAE